MNQPIDRRTIIKACLGVAALPLVGIARAQAPYPNKPIRVVIGLPAGGVADIALRALTAQMQPNFGQPFVIDNKPGASFVLAMSAMEQSSADGYTLMRVNNMMLSAQAVLKRYDMFKSLVPVATIGATDMVLAAGGKTPFKTAKDLIDFGRMNPNKLTYATPGIGTLEHLTLATFCKRNGFQATHVPYKGGPEVAQAVAAGEVEFCVTPVFFLLQFEPKGLLRGFALLNEQRNPAIPAMPTYHEAGIDTPRLVLWGGFAVPKGTPTAVIAALERQALATMDNEELRNKLTAMGINPSIKGGSSYSAKLWADDWAWISKAASEMDLDKN